MSGGRDHLRIISLIGAGLAIGLTVYAFWPKRLVDEPSDDLGDIPFVPRGIVSRAAPVAVTPYPATGAHHFWGLTDDEGFRVHSYFDGSFHDEDDSHARQ